MAVGRGSVVITGIREIDRRLRSLEPRLQKRVLRQAMRKGLKILAAEVKAQAPVDTGMTRSKVQVRAVKSRRRGSIELEVRIAAVDELKKTSAKSGQQVFYPAIIEYGRDGVPPDPFVRRAFESKGGAARQVTIESLKAGIEAEIAKKG